MSRAWLSGLAFFLLLINLLAAQDDQVGPVRGGGVLVPTAQLIRAAGESLAFVGRPVDLVFSPGGQWLFVKDNRGVLVVDATNWKLLQELPFPKDKGGGSMHGLAVRRDGKRLYATTAQQLLWEAEIGEKGDLKWARSIPLPGPGGKGDSHATGIALTRDGQRAYVCLSRNNALGIVDLKAGKLVDQIPVGVAPFAVLLASDERIAYVSNWGGRRARPGDRTALSAGTPVVVDARGVASSGTVCRVDLKTRRMRAEVETGLHPAGLVLSPTGKALYVANANSDTVSVLDAETLKVEHTVVVRPDEKLPFGSATNALTLSPDGKTLFAANGGNNAVAVLEVGAGKPTVRGFLPAGWYPGAVICDERYVYIANVKGEGSRTRDAKMLAYGVYGYKGTVNRVPIPTAKQLAEYTRQVREDARVPEILRALERGEKGVKPVPVPAMLGEPSVFQHVVYVIKENRTYDQVFGDLKQGNGDPKLCIFPRALTPNHHALAEEFVLLDNFYCNGVLSADGHSWVTEGNVTDHLEKSFGGFTRSYTFGDDPLTYSSTGFVWDNALLHGRSFRNYGEMRESNPVPAQASFLDLWKDYRNGGGKIRLEHKMYLETLQRYTHPDYPGWNMKITDQQRIDVFLQEFREFEKKGTFPDLVMVYLPQDHTSGTSPGMPTPRAHMADNDLALGRMVEAITQSKFWPRTVIFVIEDDPQDGFDHVDGHRSLCLVISPYTKRKQVVSRFYNQTSVLHTIERILGLPAMNQLDGLAPLMTECFTSKADYTPYRLRKVTTALDELNPPMKKLKKEERVWAEKSLQQDLSRPDRIHDDTFNRVLWHAMKGADVPYPEAWAGAHGRGLKAQGLRLENGRVTWVR